MERGRYGKREREVERGETGREREGVEREIRRAGERNKEGKDT